MKRILYVGGEIPDGVRLSERDFEVVREESVEGAVEIFRENRMDDTNFDCIVSKHDLDDKDGIDLLESVRELSDIPFVLYVEDGSEEIASRAVSLDATEYVTSSEELGELVESLVNEHRQETIREMLLEHMTDAFIAVDHDWRFTYVNQEAEELLNRESGKLMGKKIWDEFPDAVGSTFEDEYRRAVEEQEEVSFEEYYEPLETWFEVRAYPDEDGLSIYFRDVTERKEREEELKVMERAMDEASVGITISDPSQEDNPIVYANDAFNEITGYTTDYIIGRNCRFLQGEDTDPETVAEIRRGIDNEETVEVDILNYTREGEEFWNHLVITPVWSEGEVTNYIGVQQDFTERKELKEEIRESEEFLRRIYEIISDPGTEFEDKIQKILETGCKKLDLNIGFLSTIDTERNDFEVIEAMGNHALIQKGSTSDLSETYCRKVVKNDRTVSVNHASQRQEEWVGDPAYEKFELQCYIGAKIEVDNELYGTLCFADKEPREREFTEAERTFVELMAQWLSYELERRESQKKLEIQNKRLEEFASVVSHDLRNPLNIAKGHTDLLIEKNDDNSLEQVHDALERMDQIIDDVLTLAHQGEEVTEEKLIDLDDSATEAWSNVETDEATFESSFDKDVVEADRSRLLNVFENLFRNSVQHAGEDVSVRVGRMGDGEGFYIEDDGPGIPEDERENVFKQGYSTHEDGTGFGLPIVKEVAEAHGWEVSITESKEGGARFEFIFG